MTKQGAIQLRRIFYRKKKSLFASVEQNIFYNIFHWRKSGADVVIRDGEPASSEKQIPWEGNDSSARPIQEIPSLIW